MIVNEDLTDILYSSECLEFQMFCISLSLFILANPKDDSTIQFMSEVLQKHT